MITRLARLALLASLPALGALPACGGDGGAPPDDGAPRLSLRVMTRNLYLGADLFSVVLTPGPAQIPAQAAALWQTVQDSDPTGRVRLLAREIADHAPDLVSLQEVERYRTQRPSNIDLGGGARGPPDASDDAYDFLTLLQAGLAEHGARYQAIENVLTDVELPAATGDGGRMDVRLTDRDVILVREGISYSNVVRRTFAAKIAFNIGGPQGVPLDVVRGLVRVDVVADGVPLTFVASHLEVGGAAAPTQEAQARELVAELQALPGTLVVAGDFNSAAAPAAATTTSYGQLTSILTDGWLRPRPADPGLTCCSDLDAPAFQARSRIDLVLHRGPVRAEDAAVVGTDATRRTVTELWPSDHAGVVMTLSVRR
jgi:endonuclease/exonuclease/phosphatase family metal-dependent hydrolase